MKKIVLFLIIMFSNAYLSFTQDIIKLKDGTTQEVFIKNITDSEVRYSKKKYSDILYAVPKNGVEEIVYKSGKKEIFSNIDLSVSGLSKTTSSTDKTSSVIQAQNQDLIILNDGTTKEGYIKEISESEIKYNKKGNPDLLYTILKQSVSEIIFKNGEKESFKNLKNVALESTKGTIQENKNTSSVVTNTVVANAPITETKAETVSQPINKNSILTKKDYSDMFQQGKNDARIYYKGYKGAATGTFLTTFLLSPLLGLVPAVACSTTSPSTNNLVFPNMELTHNSDYVNGYIQEAHAKKSRKVWGNFGIATGILAALLISVQASAK